MAREELLWKIWLLASYPEVSFLVSRPTQGEGVSLSWCCPFLSFHALIASKYLRGLWLPCKIVLTVQRQLRQQTTGPHCFSHVNIPCKQQLRCVCARGPSLMSALTLLLINHQQYQRCFRQGASKSCHEYSLFCARAEHTLQLWQQPKPLCDLNFCLFSVSQHGSPFGENFQ